MKKLIEKIHALEWKELIENDNKIFVIDNRLLLEQLENKTIFHFLTRNDNDGDISYDDRYSQLKTIDFSIDFDCDIILTKDLKLRHYKQFNDVFEFNNNKIESITITSDVDSYEIQRDQKCLAINPESVKVIVDTYTAFYDGAKGYYNKYLNYKESEFKRSYFGIHKERKTLTSKGEFAFLIDRFNLPTKRFKSDFEKYLNENDKLSLQDISLSLIQNEIFGRDYLTRLNDYFIKIKLVDIIKLGREIIKLKSTNLKTLGAKKIISKIAKSGDTIKQLESVWQKYFENYLSFLIFSYQYLYPKIELNVDLKKRYPDFIGINHFGGVDIIEIKTHLKFALTKDSSHDNYAFSSEMSKAIIQTINYIDSLIQEKIKNKSQRLDIKGKILEGNIYRPQGIIIISSYDCLAKGVKPGNKEFDNVQRDFTKLRHGLHNIRILTFDELLNTAENYKNNFVK